MSNKWRMEWFDPGEPGAPDERAGYYLATISGATYQEAIEGYARRYWTAEHRKLIGKVTLFALEGQEVML